MPSAVRQVAVWDPNPSVFGSFTVGTMSGNVADASAVGSYATFPLDTLPGSTIVAMVMTAYDGANLVGNMCDPINGPYTAVDAILNTFGASNMHTKTFIMPNAGVLKAASWSGQGHLSTSGPSFRIDVTDSGIVHIGDVVMGASVPHGCVVQSLTSGTPSQPGAVYNLPSPAGNVNISQEAMTVANPVIVRYNHSGDYEGMIIMEVTGVTSNPLVGHAAQALSLVTGTDAATSGLAQCGTQPVQMIAFAINGNDAHSPYAPNQGTGFANRAAALLFNIGQGLAAYEYNNFANPGNKAGTFTPSGATDDFTVMMLALLDQATIDTSIHGCGRVDIYDEQNGTALIAWPPFPGPAPDSYNVYVNGVLNVNVATRQAIVTGLHGSSYNGVTVTPPGQYTIRVAAVKAGVEQAISAERVFTATPTSTDLVTPMKRPFPFPNVGP